MAISIGTGARVIATNRAEREPLPNRQPWQDWLDEQEGFGFADDIKAYIRSLEGQIQRLEARDAWKDAIGIGED